MGKRPLVTSAAVAIPIAGVLTCLVGWPVAVVVTPATGWLCHRLLKRRAHGSTDPLRLASGWDLLAAGLRAGLPIPATVRAVAAEFTGGAEAALLEVAECLALGADPVSAWERAMRHPDTVELARSARRAARTGSGLAGVAEGIAAQARASMDEHAQARAQRAAVWVSAPLGLCFLPAFLCLGVAPVVVGMLDRLM
ncbi:type II secretion system F family protein [Haloactinomyces albus]|uniref:Pilus assembly protein TadC n=1 Tax=Haloactinomyces albus TaxID=1352928 RepID=A0AAE3ZD92_9ACTN|nr:type II secretion system F family protein [Haloactinomyces albus]MDR7301715.1 pilus assembly protein TadC [Haloactinomyces albus]